MNYFVFIAFISSAFATNIIEHDAEQVFHIIKALPRDCYTFDNGQYIFEYCHMESARQMVSQLHGNERLEWDLGHFKSEKSAQKYCPFQNLAKIALVDGSPCPEAHHKRKSKVKFLCIHPDLSMHIANVVEKTTCNYKILVHVPQLCFK